MNLPALPRLYYFYRTALKKNISLTAKELFISQPALSIQIRELEKDISCQLFWRRSKRNLILTKEGEKLFETCQSLFEKLESTITQLQQGQTKGYLTVSVSQSFGSYVILPLIKKFRQAYPQITIRIYLTDEIVDLRTKQMDVAIRWGDVNDDKLKTELLMEVTIEVAASKTYLKQNPRIRNPGDLSGQTIICWSNTSQGWAPWVEALPKKDRPELKNHLIIDSFVAQLEAVRSGMGVALLPRYLIDHANKHSQSVIPLPLPKMKYSVYSCYLKTDFVPERIRCFCKFLKDNLNILGFP